MVFRLELAYSESREIFDTKKITTSCTRYTLPPGIFEISDFKLRINSFLPDDVKVDITIDNKRLTSKLTTNKTVKFTKKIFLQYDTRFKSVTPKSFE